MFPKMTVRALFSPKQPIMRAATKQHSHNKGGLSFGSPKWSVDLLLPVPAAGTECERVFRSGNRLVMTGISGSDGHGGYRGAVLCLKGRYGQGKDG